METQNSNFSSRHKNEEAYYRAQKRLKEIKGFYWHLFWYAIINLFLIFFISQNSGNEFWSFSTFSTPIFWGIGLGFHAVRVFGINKLFSKSWEQRKMKEFMEKERKKWE